MITTAKPAIQINKNSDARSFAQAKNPMFKIILLVGIAIVVFLAFILYSLDTSVTSNEKLSAIKDLYFPVLERVDANIVRLDHIEERMLEAVMTGEHDQVDTAAEFYQQANVVFTEMEQLYPSKLDDIKQLRLEYSQYFELAKKTSETLLENGGVDTLGISGQMNDALTALRQHIRQFRSDSYDNFVITLEASQNVAKINLYLSIAVGVMNLLFMVVLVYFIRNNVKMVAIIAEQNALLEQRVIERTAALSQKTHDINAMLQNMNLGVCTVVPGNLIHNEFSNYLSVIFATQDIANQNVMSCLFRSALIGVDGINQIDVALQAIIGEDAMMYDFNNHLLVREMQVQTDDEKIKKLQLDWNPIINDEGIVEKMLLIVQDVTALRELEQASAQQKEELDIIAQIIKISVGKFNNFISSAQKFVEENRRLLKQTSGNDQEVIAALFRNMHTIKGNARTYEFSLITNAAHAAEQHYDYLRNNKQADWCIETLLSELQVVDNAINRYLTINEDKLGRKGRAATALTSRGSFISNSEITELKKCVADLSVYGNNTELLKLQHAVAHIGLIPLSRLISAAIDSVSSLAKELQKPVPNVDVSNVDIAFTAEFAEALSMSFMHIVRNAMDHGIETPSERMAVNKSESGRLRFHCENIDNAIQLHISDDGRGLALHKLFAKAVATGLFEQSDKPSPERVADLIFNAGLSTADQVTLVSGRGVGMDAVRRFLLDQGASIRVQLTEQKSTYDFTAFKFIIDLPTNVYSY